MKYIDHQAEGRTDEAWFTAGAWTPQSDTDLAVFSDQLKASAVKREQLGAALNDPSMRMPIHTKYGVYKPGEAPGFSSTPVGQGLYRYGEDWDKKIYSPDVLAMNKDGLFDFKLNFGNDPFTTPPTVHRGPAAAVPPVSATELAP